MHGTVVPGAQVVGKKYKYLGLFTSEADAAIAYDRAAVQAKRLHAQTNFDISNYMDLLSAPLPRSTPFCTACCVHHVVVLSSCSVGQSDSSALEAVPTIASRSSDCLSRSIPSAQQQLHSRCVLEGVVMLDLSWHFMHRSSHC